MTDRIEPHFGSAVEAGQRFARPHLEQQLQRLLRTSNGIGMFGLRRTGKSTLARSVQGALSDSFTVIDIDAQGFRALDHLLFEILRALSKDHGLGQRIMTWVSGPDAVPAALREALKQAAAGFGVHDPTTTAAISAYWQVIADQVAHGLRQEPRPRLLLSIDEFPFMCKGILERDGTEAGRTTVNQLLAALRLWRDAGLKMLLTGSIGMAALERQYQLDPVHLNDLRPFSVPPLGDMDPEEPRRFVEALVCGTPALTGWGSEHTSALLEESVALYPSFLQFAFSHLAAMPLVAPSKFADIFATEIRPQLNGPFLDQFDARLKSYRNIGPGTEALAYEILRQIVSKHPASCPRDLLTDALGEHVDNLASAELFRLLHEDGFLLERTSREGDQDWRLSSGLVLTWWRQRGFGRRR